MKKVYCKNCIYEGYPSSSYCEVKLLPMGGNEYIGKRPAEEVHKKMALNCDGQCSHYKRKWYKFWC